MTEREIVPDQKRAVQDVVLSALNLNAALQNFRKAGGDSFLLENRLWLRLLDDTEQLLKEISLPQATRISSNGPLDRLRRDARHSLPPTLGRRVKGTVRTRPFRHNRPNPVSGVKLPGVTRGHHFQGGFGGR